jgi:hypothetical protein
LWHGFRPELLAFSVTLGSVMSTPKISRDPAGDERFWRRAAFAVVVAGLLLRVALYFPLAAFPADSDGTVTGLCGLQVQDGNLLVFSPDGTRHSAIRCYVTALYFSLVGPGRTGLALTGLTFEALYLAFMLLFLRAVLDAKRAFIAMLFAAVPPVQFLIASYVPWGYGEVMAAGAAILYFAARWRRDPTPWTRCGFGLATGLGLWFSLQTLMVSAPALLWIALRRRRAMIGEAWPAFAAMLIGFAPWLVYNFANGFPSLTANFATRPAASLAQVWDNVLYLLAYNLPMLLADGSSHHWGLASTALILAYGLLAAGVLFALRTPSTPLATGEDVGSAVLLGAMVIACTLLLSVVSEPGSIRGWTVRYIAPLYLVMPFLVTIALFRLSETSVWLAVVPALVLLGLNVSSYSLPGTARREALTANLAQHERLRRRLMEAGVDAVVGDFWLVYHLNFDSGRKLVAVPFQRHSDYFDVWHPLPKKGVRWAMLAGSEDELLKRAGRIGAHGRIVDFEELKLFLPDPPASELPTEALLSAMRGVQ